MSYRSILNDLFNFQSRQEVLHVHVERLQRDGPDKRGVENPARKNPLRIDHDRGEVRRRPRASTPELQGQARRLKPDGDSNPGAHDIRELERDPRVSRRNPLSGAGTLRGEPGLGGQSDAREPERCPIVVHCVLSEHASLKTSHRGHGW